MIQPISKTFYNKVVHQRKSGYRWEKGIFFIAANGKCYRTTEADPTAVKEVHAFKKRIKAEVDARPKQIGLL